MINWGFLPATLPMVGAAIGCTLFARQEGRSGNAYFLFWPVKHWSRDRQPTLFQIRQITNWIMVVFLALGALVFFLEFAVVD